MKIEDQVIAVTGASAGIGEATARLLADKGARVVLAARRQDTLARIVAEIQVSGGQAASRAVDVTRPEDLRQLVALAVDRFGRLDTLVSNAGVATVAPLADGSLADAGFVHAILKIGAGRSEAAKSATKAGLFDIMKAHFADHYQKHGLALSLEFVEFSESGTLKHNNLHSRLRKA